MGDMKVDGRCFVAARKPKTAAPAPAPPPAETAAGATDELSELDFTDLLEEEEGRTDHLSEHGVDLGEALHGLTRVLRKQHRQMDAHDERIGELRQQLAELMAR